MTHRLSLAFPSGQLLHAAVAGPADDRTRVGKLVPFNEPGRTNLGRGIAVRPEFAASLRQDALAKFVGVYGHNREASVSRLLSWEARQDGIWGRIFINATALGDQLLAEIEGGARDGLSIEADQLQFDSAGHIIAGELDFYAHVPVGAYDSARIYLAAPVTTTPGDSVTLPTLPALPAAPAAQPVLAAQTAAPAGPPLPPLLQANLTAPVAPPAPAQVPAPAAQPAPVATAAPAVDLAGLQTLLAGLQALQAGVHVAAPAAVPEGPSAAALLGTPAVPPAPAASAATGLAGDPVQEAARLQAGLAGGDYSLVAALQDITHSGLPMFQRPAGTVGQKLWEGSNTARNWVDLTDTSTPLTSMKYTTWQWTRGPEVKAWNGDKNEVPSNPVSLEEIPGTARRCAGGWDVDRAYRDFGTTEFWTEFYKEQTESYRELTNLWAAQALVGFALDVSVDANVPASYLTVDRTVDAGPTQVLKAAALGTAILEDTPKVRQGPDWIAMNTFDWLTLIDLTNLDLPSFMALLKINPANFMRTADVPRGQVVMGVKRAAKTRELGGGAPIRVEALDVARGGIDSAVYGYVGYSLERPGGIISVPLAPAAP